MRQKSGMPKPPAEKVIKDIRHKIVECIVTQSTEDEKVHAHASRGEWADAGSGSV